MHLKFIYIKLLLLFYIFFENNCFILYKQSSGGLFNEIWSISNCLNLANILKQTIVLRRLNSGIDMDKLFDVENLSKSFSIITTNKFMKNNCINIKKCFYIKEKIDMRQCSNKVFELCQLISLNLLSKQKYNNHNVTITIGPSVSFALGMGNLIIPNPSKNIQSFIEGFIQKKFHNQKFACIHIRSLEQKTLLKNPDYFVKLLRSYNISLLFLTSDRQRLDIDKTLISQFKTSFLYNPFEIHKEGYYNKEEAILAWIDHQICYRSTIAFFNPESSFSITLAYQRLNNNNGGGNYHLNSNICYCLNHNLYGNHFPYCKYEKC